MCRTQGALLGCLGSPAVAVGKVTTKKTEVMCLRPRSSPVVSLNRRISSSSSSAVWSPSSPVMVDDKLAYQRIWLRWLGREKHEARRSWRFDGSPIVGAARGSSYQVRRSSVVLRSEKRGSDTGARRNSSWKKGKGDCVFGR